MKKWCRPTVLLVSVMVFLIITGVIAALCSTNPTVKDFAQTWSGLATAFGLLCAVVSIVFAINANEQSRKSAQESREASEFAAVGAVHATLNNRRSYALRRYLIGEFPGHLEKAFKVLEDETKLALRKDGRIDYREIDRIVVKDGLHDKFREVLIEMKSKETCIEGEQINAREAAELLLLDLDLILTFWR